MLTFLVPTSQNGQTHSNNSSAISRRYCLSVFDHFARLALKGLRVQTSSTLFYLKLLRLKIQYFHKKLLCQSPLLRKIESWVQNGSIATNGVVSLTTLLS